MNVLFDGQIFFNQRFGGISRLYVELLRRLPSMPDVERVALGLAQNRNHYVSNSRLDQLTGGKILEYKDKNNLYHRILRRFVHPFDWQDNSADLGYKQSTIEHLRSGDFDVFHPTYYDDYFVPHLGKTRLVVTIYDMIHEIFPEYFPEDHGTSLFKRKLAQRADLIIAISENTKRDVIEFLDVPAERIVVTGLGSSMDPASTTSVPRIALPSRYLLNVGARGNYKNFLFLLEAVAPLLRGMPDLHLVSTGDTFSAEETRFIESLCLEHKVHTVSADDAALPQLYKQAAALVYPSVYEGFGIPVLESMSCGCPVVVARSSSLTEVGGDAVEYFEPKSLGSMRSAIRRVLEDETLRASLRERGHDRAKLFSWQKCAEQTLDAYRRATASTSPA